MGQMCQSPQQVSVGTPALPHPGSLSRGTPYTLIAAPLVLGAGQPKGAGHAEAAENDDGADPLPVHVRVPRSHSVPEKLKAHISSPTSDGDLIT